MINLEKTPATVENVEAMEIATATVVENVEATATATKKNTRKAGKKAMNTEKTTATAPVETVPAPVVEEITPATATAPVENETEQPTPAPVVEENPPTVEALRLAIFGDIKEEQARLSVWIAIDLKGSQINATNWSKTTTKRGSETLGGYVADRLEYSRNRIKALKRDLKETYFDLLPELKALQNNENPFVQWLVNDCIENMYNIPIFELENQLKAETVEAFANAGVKEIGVCQSLLGFAMPLFMANGYELTPPPVTVDPVEIDGLDPVKGYTFYKFVKKA